MKSTIEQFENDREDSVAQSGLYAGSTLNSCTFEPAEERENPLTGEVIAVEGSLVSTIWLLHPCGTPRNGEVPEFSDLDLWPDRLIFPPKPVHSG